MEADTTFDQWAIVELFGHQRRAGRVTKADFPEGFVRLDVPDGPTQLINPKAVYALTPTAEEVARAAAARWKPAPVSRFELEPMPASSAPSQGLYADDDSELF